MEPTLARNSISRINFVACSDIILLSLSLSLCSRDKIKFSKIDYGAINYFEEISINENSLKDYQFSKFTLSRRFLLNDRSIIDQFNRE